MKITERINSLVQLGILLSDLETPDISSVLHKAEIENPWFTQQNIRQSIIAIRDQYLSESALNMLAGRYHLDDNIEVKRVGIILAGNIPLVGFHDVLCCFMAGHHALLKFSDKDKVLMKWVINLLTTCDPNTKTYFTEVEKLQNYDAAIATGSNTSATHFEYYFRHIPHLIRKNRNSVAVLSGNESADQIKELGFDIFTYFGLGCRNVSMIFIPKDYEIRHLFVGFDSFKDIKNHNKYKNNFDYNHALMLLNKEDFLQNEFLILKKSDQIISRIASAHYQYYSDIASLTQNLLMNKGDIQCVVSEVPIEGFRTVGFGSAQSPAIDDYADGADTMQFLLGL
jgi:hypothetical protein